MKADRLIKVTAGVLIVGTLAACSGTSIEATSTPQPEPERTPTHLPTDVPIKTPESTFTPKPLPTEAPTVEASPIPEPTAQPTETAVTDVYGREFIFSQDKDGQFDIYKAIEGSDGRLQDSIDITNSDESNELNAQPFEKDKIVYTKTDKDWSNSQIALKDLTTGEEKLLTGDNKGNWDPTGIEINGEKRILYKSDNDIYIMNRDGSNKTNLTPDRKATEEWNPIPMTISNPDGTKTQKILFVSRLDPNGRKGVPDNSDEIFVMNTDGSEIKQLTKNDVPDWFGRPITEDSTDTPIEIVFISNSEPKKPEGETQPPDNLFTMKIDGKRRIQITFSKTDMGDPISDSARKRIIALLNDGTNYNIVSLDLNGENIRPIEEEDGNILSPAILNR